MKKLALALVLVLLPALAAAQTVTSTVIWDYNSATLNEVNGYAKSVTVDGTLLVSPITCVQVGTRVECRQATATPLSNAPHDIVIAYVQNGVQKELRATIDLAKGPKDASAPRITVTTVTVTP